MVCIRLCYDDGICRNTEDMNRWFADWLLANVIVGGFYRGQRVMTAIIVVRYN